MRQALRLARLDLCIARISQKRRFTGCSALRKVFQEGDIVLLRDKNETSHDTGKLLTLDRSKTTGTRRGLIKHDDIIGKQPRQTVQTHKNHTLRIHEPTLGEYVRLTPRIVTPIYPSDANLVVSLLDIHVDTYGSTTGDEPTFEILEAGTGHGALTLHLSRAIHAANPPFPRSSSASSNPTPQAVEDAMDGAIYEGAPVSDIEITNLESWKANRRAIIHTLDIAVKHTKHAKQIVQGFRHGMYARNVDFHVGDVSEWIAEQKELRNIDGPFLSHVFLDMPNADRHLGNVAEALRANGILAVFNPSITQIAECVALINKQRLPYLLDQVVELGVGNIRQWDVRPVRPRATLREKGGARQPEATLSDSPVLAAVNEVEGQKARDRELAQDSAKQGEEFVMVCRPKVGELVVGGGFLALWRRMEPAQRRRSGDSIDGS
ncbi:S-adenosyl-L-methionine-dependent methyltransferase [Westerdykella ornata]|uniref:tRNA (adenine(58)-N(1))-methyltransferase catalytic subunit TRM61 n=1 Tax=Westerdykella ornata TaxID=318751 RepID=A0A6A6JHD9_WESOR|nr:S-adenosyl-L-methionine-dependent methyltransferase [Westerdykella ornata]KAF2275066.1 S-adenosyl-L-methionine-dependent methyltransferase [Westerdykella ornata]